MTKGTEHHTDVPQGMQTKVKIKNRRFVTDEPPALEGQNEEINPLATLLGALAGCGNVISTLVAKDISFDL